MLSAQKRGDAILCCPRNVQLVKIYQILLYNLCIVGVVGRNHGASLVKQTDMWPIFTDLGILSWHPCKGINHISVDRHVKSTTGWYKVHFILCISRLWYIDELNKIGLPVKAPVK